MSSHIARNLAIGFVFAFLLCWSLFVTYSWQYEASWREGKAFVNTVYRYNSSFWRIYCYSQAAQLNGEFWLSRSFNITEGWWYLIVKGDVVINAWRVD
jgi:hypothetical protein